MTRRVMNILMLFLCFCAVPVSIHAQEFMLFDRKVQIHGFVSQGFAYTDNNNWLTMKTSDGSAAFTDFGVNISVPITERLRIGAQMYSRNIGNLGDWHPTLDWAYADYRFASWFGVRGGKVKTVFGLYNDTQDLDFIHTFALLPQSIYPTDMRESTIAHMGGDFYGDVDLGKGLGKLSYTAFAGIREDSQQGGYPYLLRPVGIRYHSYGGIQYGGDLRWQTPLEGLTVGMSRMNERIDGDGSWTIEGFGSFPTHEESIDDWMNQYYGRFAKGKFTFDAEYRRYYRNQAIFSGMATVTTDVRGWYIAGSYQVLDWLRLGSYFSRYALFSPNANTGPTDEHINDAVVTARFDVNRFVNVKLEGHFMDGYGAPGLYPSGFYTSDNPQGFQNKTNGLVARVGFNF